MTAGSGSLRARLTATVVFTVLAVIAVGIYVDYRREYRVHIDEVIVSLEEQARGLKVAHERIPGLAEFSRHIDEFCSQMNDYVSPGHHILVLDGRGNVIARSQHHSGPEVEKAILAADPRERILNLATHRLAQVRLVDGDGTTIVLAQYLDHIERILVAQLVSRAVTAGVMAGALILLLWVALNGWVLKPLVRLTAAARAWSDRDFSARTEPAGPSDLRALAQEFNEMAGELEAHERGRAAEMEQARRIQANLLPAGLPSVANLVFAADYRPAEHVAGDLYDVFPLPGGKTAIVVLDVAGHGISAALLTGVVKMSLHRRMAECDNPAEALSRVNHDLFACMPPDRFVTACLGVWNPRDRTWTYAAAGHPEGVLISGAKDKRLDATGPPLGVMPDAEWSQRVVPLSPGDRVFIYTDGVTDAGAPGNALGAAGLVAKMRESAGMPLKEQVTCLMDAAARRNGKAPSDDLTLVAFEVLS